ncbi:MAG: glycosyltransferase family 39 protein [Bacteroidetes bacterium]|nr:glycosyltransferase family 39 protein [Bacteroidota bacterium]
MTEIVLKERFWKSKKVWYLVLFIFIFLNLFSKFYYLPEESIYGDEAYSIYHAQKPLSELVDIFLHDQNPPMQIVTLHYWMAAFGVTDISAKSFSVILSVLCSIVLLFFSKKFLNKEATIYVSILFLLSNVQLFYSHEVRTYAMVQFLCICSFYFYFELIYRPSKGKISMLTLINLLLLFSHYLTIFILVTQFLCVWMYFKNNRKGVISYIVSGFLLVILFLPWLKILIANLPKNGSFWMSTPHFGELKIFIFMLNGNELLFFIFSGIILSSVLMILLNKRFRFFVKEFDIKKYTIFLVLYLLPIALDFIVAQYSPVFLLRYFLYSSIGLFLVVAYIISNLNIMAPIRVLLFLPLLAFLLIAFDAKPQKEDDWRSLVSQVKSLQNKKTIVLISASYKFKDFCFYYDLPAFKDYNNSLKRLEQQNVFCPLGGFFDWKGVDVDSVDQILFVQAHRQFEDPKEKLKENILDKKFRICSEYSERNITLTIFKREGLDCNPLKIIGEQLPTKNEFWKIQTGIREQLLDTVLVYSTDMEPNPLFGLPYGIIEGIAKSGNFSSKIDSHSEYSVGIVKSIKDDLKGFREINISANTFYEEGSKGRVVVSVERAGQILYWKDAFISDKLKTPKEWHEMVFSTIIPDDLPDDCVLKVYFWNQDAKPAYVDDFQIKLSKVL